VHSAFGDRIAARHAELIDAAVRLPLGADDLIELGGVEIDRGLRGVGAGGQRSLARRQPVRMAWRASPDRHAR
jgi:hypothetical protein